MSDTNLKPVTLPRRQLLEIIGQEEDSFLVDHLFEESGVCKFHIDQEVRLRGEDDAPANRGVVTERMVRLPGVR